MAAQHRVSPYRVLFLQWSPLFSFPAPLSSSAVQTRSVRSNAACVWRCRTKEGSPYLQPTSFEDVCDVTPEAERSVTVMSRTPRTLAIQATEPERCRRKPRTVKKGSVSIVAKPLEKRHRRPLEACAPPLSNQAVETASRFRNVPPGHKPQPATQAHPHPPPPSTPSPPSAHQRDLRERPSPKSWRRPVRSLAQNTVALRKTPHPWGRIPWRA
jgi:hypothetical protein